MPHLLLLLLAACRPAEPDAGVAAPALPVAAVAPGPAETPAPGLTLRALAPGFEYGRWTLPASAPVGDGLVRFVRVDPRLVDIELRAASTGDGRPRAASAWAAPDADRAAVAVINAAMFQDDDRTNVGYLRHRGRVQNPTWAPDSNALLTLDPTGGDLPGLHNLGCEDRVALLGRFATAVQSIRMIGCAGENVWAEERRRWSSALLGADKEGRLLLLFTRSPYTMNDLVDMLLQSPLGLVGLHYGDGGPPAALYVRGPGFEERNVGSYETGVQEHDANVTEWALPNVVVVRGR